MEHLCWPYTWLCFAHVLFCNCVVIVNLGQLLKLIDGRVRCRCHDGSMYTKKVKTMGLGTSLHMTCDGCGELEVWDADECRVLFSPSSRSKTISALTIRMVFSMMAVGMARASCNLILSSMNIKVRHTPPLYGNRLKWQFHFQPLHNFTYQRISQHLERVIESVCTAQIAENLKEEIRLSKKSMGTTKDGSLQDIACSYDGSWMKRGHHSGQVISCCYVSNHSHLSISM